MNSNVHTHPTVRSMQAVSEILEEAEDVHTRPTLTALKSAQELFGACPDSRPLPEPDAEDVTREMVIEVDWCDPVSADFWAIAPVAT